MAIGLMLTTAACGSSDPDAAQTAAPIQRTPLPRSEFIPLEIEATIDELVVEINKSSIEPMQIAVLLKSRAMGELGASGRATGNVLALQH
ncbi:hypothetical protein BE20_25625 [Sorangium cellulosum]|nr:hypothetical protein BE20_25625 [Sorangium cellulosum]